MERQSIHGEQRRGGAGNDDTHRIELTGGAGSGYDHDPSTKRQALGVFGSKWLGGTFQLEGSVNSEKKTGNQLFGIGNNCPSTASSGCSFTPGSQSGFGVLYTPLPIDYNHTQVEARLNYAGSSLQLSGGYYGSFFSNNNGALTPGVPSTLNNAIGAPLPAGPGVQSYLGQAVASSPEKDWFLLPSTSIGIQYIWRSLDQYSPRYLPNEAEEFAPAPIVNPVGFPNGNEWELRTYVRINVGK